MKGYYSTCFGAPGKAHAAKAHGKSGKDNRAHGQHDRYREHRGAQPREPNKHTLIKEYALNHNIKAPTIQGSLP